ncbi:hypothetical protein F5Y14DRAFT_386932 [Nemania sp. NC0429]|nr:hypothetical protein F5Y14DRAFT_386932 [Nemania sp. NC0429]
MPPTKATRTNTSGVLRQTSDGVYYGDGKFLCKKVENGKVCNRMMEANTHTISSHNSDFHKNGSYQRCMAAGDYRCKEVGCKHRSPTFNAILGHMRKTHGLRGSSDPLKLQHGLPLSKKRKNAAEEESRKKPRQEAKEDSYKGTPSSKEDSYEDKPQGTEEDGCEQPHQDGKEEATDEEDCLDEEDSLFVIDPLLRKWDRDHEGFGDGDGAGGNGGSNLFDQILSSNIIAAT